MMKKLSLILLFCVPFYTWADEATTERQRVLIVDHGHDKLREGDPSPLGYTGYHSFRFRLQKTDTGLFSPFLDIRTSHDLDVDGDASTQDSVSYLPFSLEDPMTPIAPWYDEHARSAKIYGGIAMEQANSTEAKFSELGINNMVGYNLVPRNNWTIHHELFEFYSPYRMHLLFLWPKREFFNGGAEGKVTVDKDSMFHAYNQRYFKGVDDGVRMVVKDGKQYWISEYQWRPQDIGSGQYLHLRAGDTCWAPYAPRGEWEIGFEPEGAQYEDHEFDDVQAVGFYAAKHRLGPAFFGYKWVAFEVEATVTRPVRPSQSMDMQEVKDGQLPPFWMSTTEIPYLLWRRVFKDGSESHMAWLRGGNFDRDGDMGSMHFPGPDGKLLAHSPDEPVTGITLHDAAAWLNALSLLESRTPCYYLDEACEQPFREVIRHPEYAENKNHPPLYVKWDADGYRLPTVAEWIAACSEEPLSAAPQQKSMPVGNSKANAYGLHDMLGNVWEGVWTYGDSYDPARDKKFTVLGGDFRQSRSAVASNPWGDQPAAGHWGIGFRALRRNAGLPRPDLSLMTPARIPAWSFGADEIIKGEESNAKLQNNMSFITVEELGLEVATTETPFAFWKKVRDWALANGYQFDHSGQMGSMGYWGFRDWEEPASHSPQEPVTGISFYDALVWLNALSEMEGRKPVIYTNEKMTEVLRTSYRYRPLSMSNGEQQQLYKEGKLNRNPIAKTYYIDREADGYRLPDRSEHAFFSTGSKQGRASWGNAPGVATKVAWLFENSGGTTHPVGQLKANQFGLYDVEGNVSEWSFDKISGGWGNFCMARSGGGFFDLSLGVQQSNSAATATYMMLAYPDVGFRVVRQIPGKSMAIKMQKYNR